MCSLQLAFENISYLLFTVVSRRVPSIEFKPRLVVAVFDGLILIAACAVVVLE